MRLKSLISTLQHYELTAGDKEVVLQGDTEGYWGIDRVELYKDDEDEDFINIVSDTIPKS